MKSKLLNYVILLTILIVPLSVKAATLTTYGEAVTKTNNYITTYNDRKKYLIFDKNYVYEKSGFGDSSAFKNGGLLSKSEFDLTIVSNQSYLATGKEYWTLSSTGSNKYYIDAYAQTKTPSSTSGTRVTEYIKPGIAVYGKGTYANPWTFSDGYAIDVISNNTAYGRVTPSGAQYVTPGSIVKYTLVPSNGYYYNKNKDECNLVKEGTNKYEDNYVIQNVNRDITCTAVFELQTYKFNLQINNEAKDYNNTKKTYTNNPSPNPIYYKYKTNWYSNSSTTAAINKITVPSVTGWTFNGYYYGSVKVIDAAGNILVRDLNLGSTNDFKDVEHTLYANFIKNGYTINYNLNGGSYGTKHPTSATYDEVFEVSNVTRAGYAFDGWSFNGNSSTAKTGSTSTSVNTAFIASSTKTLNQYFVNLTPSKNGTVTLTANWSACPAGTYNDGSKTTCTSCPSGYTSNVGATAQNQCYIDVTAGKYIATPNTSTQSLCPAGTSKAAHRVTYGNTSSCSTCGANTYSLAGAGSCSGCPSGYSSSAGASQCHMYDSCIRGENTCQGGYNQVWSDCASGHNTCSGGNVCYNYVTQANADKCGTTSYYSCGGRCAGCGDNKSISATSSVSCEDCERKAGASCRSGYNVACNTTNEPKTCRYCSSYWDDCASGSNTCSGGYWYYP